MSRWTTLMLCVSFLPSCSYVQAHVIGRYPPPLNDYGENVVANLDDRWMPHNVDTAAEEEGRRICERHGVLEYEPNGKLTKSTFVSTDRVGNHQWQTVCTGPVLPLKCWHAEFRYANGVYVPVPEGDQCETRTVWHVRYHDNWPGPDVQCTPRPGFVLPPSGSRESVADLRREEQTIESHECDGFGKLPDTPIGGKAG